MKEIKVLNITEEERLKLEQDYRNYDFSRDYRYRCKIILLKTKKRTAAQIAELLDISEATVYNVVKRYEKGGVKGLSTRPGQGRKPTKKHAEDEVGG